MKHRINKSGLGPEPGSKYQELRTSLEEKLAGIKKVRPGKTYWVRLQTGEEFVGKTFHFTTTYVGFDVIADKEGKESPLIRDHRESFTWEVAYHILSVAKVSLLRRRDVPLMVSYNKGPEFSNLFKE